MKKLLLIFALYILGIHNFSRADIIDYKTVTVSEFRKHIDSIISGEDQFSELNKIFEAQRKDIILACYSSGHGEYVRRIIFSDLSDGFKVGIVIDLLNRKSRFDVETGGIAPHRISGPISSAPGTFNYKVILHYLPEEESKMFVKDNWLESPYFSHEYRQSVAMRLREAFNAKAVEDGRPTITEPEPNPVIEPNSGEEVSISSPPANIPPLKPTITAQSLSTIPIPEPNSYSLTAWIIASIVSMGILSLILYKILKK